MNEYFISYHLLYNYWGPFPRTLNENIIEIARGMNRVNIVFFRERHRISMLSLYLFDFKRHFWVGELTFFVDYHLKVTWEGKIHEYKEKLLYFPKAAGPDANLTLSPTSAQLPDA